MNINIDNLKLVIFDFDDTLAIHKTKDYIEYSGDRELEYFQQAYENPATFYEDIEPCDASEQLYNLIAYLRLHNVKTFCLSGMRVSLHANAKRCFVNKHYGPDIEFLTASKQHYKIDVVKVLCNHYEYKPENILMIDDIKDVIDSAVEHGFLACEMKDIDNLTINGKALTELLDD